MDHRPDLVRRRRSDPASLELPLLCARPPPAAFHLDVEDFLGFENDALDQLPATRDVVNESLDLACPENPGTQISLFQHDAALRTADEIGHIFEHGAGLGEAPTTATGDDAVHAFLWVKRPGESDGACGQCAGTPAGQFCASYALELARNAVF